MTGRARRPSAAGAAAAGVLALALAAGAPREACAARRPVAEWIEVGDPVYRELELLRVSGLADSASVLFTRPLSRDQAARIVAQARRAHPDSRDPSLVRLERVFGRELVDRGWPAPARWTSPLATVEERGDDADVADDPDAGPPARLLLVAYADATLRAREDWVGFADRSRFGGRLNLELGGALAHLDAYAGRIADAPRYTDVLVTGSQFAASSDDAYLSWAGRGWDATFGRRRTAYGPGVSGSLLWSDTADPMTTFAIGATVFRHVRLTATHADVDATRGARLASHRIEWFPSSSFSLGIGESARYTSSHWEPLYVLPILPFTWIQRVLAEDALDRTGPQQPDRNNVMAALDASWRPSRGYEVHGEFLLDDQGLKAGGAPTRIGYQLGGRAVRGIGPGRGSAELELSRVYRYVYSTYYGEDFIHHNKPIGAPAGPDSRSLTGSVGYEPTPDWEFRLAGAWVEQGEPGLGEYYDPADTAAASGSTMGGTVQTTRSLEAGARFWPRDGVDVTAAVGYAWVDDAGHVPGRGDDTWTARFAVRLHK